MLLRSLHSAALQQKTCCAGAEVWQQLLRKVSGGAMCCCIACVQQHCSNVVFCAGAEAWQQLLHKVSGGIRSRLLRGCMLCALLSCSAVAAVTDVGFKHATGHGK